MIELPNMDAASHMHHYLRGLKESVCPFIAMQRHTNIATAQAIAAQVDAVTFKPTPRTGGFQANPQYRPTNGPIPMELDAISKLTQGEREHLCCEGGCFCCRKKGHLACDCTMTNHTHLGIHALKETEELGKD